MAKSIVCIIITSLAISILFFSDNSIAQCNSKAFFDNCSSGLNEYRFLKSQIVDIKSEEDAKQSVYTFYFYKNVDYLILICDQNNMEKHLVVEIFNQKNQLLTSNYDEENDQYFTRMKISTQSSGGYYMSYHFGKGKTGCGIVIIGFKGHLENSNNR